MSHHSTPKFLCKPSKGSTEDQSAFSNPYLEAPWCPALPLSTQQPPAPPPLSGPLASCQTHAICCSTTTHRSSRCLEQSSPDFHSSFSPFSSRLKSHLPPHSHHLACFHHSTSVTSEICSPSILPQENKYR